jgi:hypothetical protein
VVGQGTVALPGNGGVYTPNGGHSGTYHGGYFMTGGPVSTRLGGGPNGCGSCGQDAAFVFGSCRSFFSPCGGMAAGCGGHGHGGKGGCGGHGNGHGLGFLLRGGCINPVGGTGPAQGFNPCCYDSYLNH